MNGRCASPATARDGCRQAQRRSAPLLATLAIATVLAACSNRTDTPAASGPAAAQDQGLPVLVRNRVPATLAHQALVRGRLHLDAAGCLRVGDDGPFVIWHHDSRIERTGDGRIRITDGFTGNSADVGDEIALGGSGGPDLPANVTPPVPPACANGEFWMAGGLMSAAERDALPAPGLEPAPSPDRS